MIKGSSEFSGIPGKIFQRSFQPFVVYFFTCRMAISQQKWFVEKWLFPCLFPQVPAAIFFYKTYGKKNKWTSDQLAIDKLTLHKRPSHKKIFLSCFLLN